MGLEKYISLQTGESKTMSQWQSYFRREAIIDYNMRLENTCISLRDHINFCLRHGPMFYQLKKEGV